MQTRNIFVSHSWAYESAYQRLIALLDAAPDFSFRDYSVPRSHPVHNARSQKALYAAIKRQMSFCHVVIFIAGKYATYSEWIQHEMQIAKGDFDKRVLAVRPRGSFQVSDD